MAHVSTIRCDRCPAEMRLKSEPYPHGWSMLTLITYDVKDGGIRKETKHLDLCATCTAEVHAAAGEKRE